MSSSFSEQPDYFGLKLIHSEDIETIKSVEDILYAIKACCRKIKMRIEYLEKQTSDNLELDKEMAVLIRQNQYLQVLLRKEKYELEDIFFPNGKSNCIIPDVFLWYKEPEN